MHRSLRAQQAGWLITRGWVYEGSQSCTDEGYPSLLWMRVAQAFYATNNSAAEGIHSREQVATTYGTALLQQHSVYKAGKGGARSTRRPLP